MSSLQILEEQLASLTPAEKAQLLQSVARDLGDAFPGIESHPNVCAEAMPALCEREFRSGFLLSYEDKARAIRKYSILIQRWAPRT